MPASSARIAELAAAYRQYEEFLTQADQVKLASGAPNGSPDVFQIGSNAAPIDMEWPNPIGRIGPP